MGAIMAMGVATAQQSVLLITFRRRSARARVEPRCRPAVDAGLRALRARVHDGARDDHRHVADGARSWRRRRAERAARPRGDRRPARRDGFTLIVVPLIYSVLRHEQYGAQEVDVRVPANATADRGVPAGDVDERRFSNGSDP